ncbi:MAG: hypothetical protein GW893_09655 [Armatimonadetes bacterium]|nr:hypothetical protein [Armatimonadota bacterium]
MTTTTGEGTSAVSSPNPPHPAAPVTGLVIDANGMGVKRSMSPAIFDEQGNLIYPTPELKFDSNQSLVSYLASADQAPKSRVGGNPLTIQAINVSGAARTAVVVGSGDAERIRQEDQKHGFLKKLSVAFLIGAKPPKPPEETTSPESQPPTPPATTPATPQNPPAQPATPAETAPPAQQGGSLVIPSILNRPDPGMPAGALQSSSVAGGTMTVKYDTSWQLTGEGESFLRLSAAKDSDLSAWIDWRDAPAGETLDARAQRQLERQKERSAQVEQLPNRNIAGVPAFQIAWVDRLDDRTVETLHIEWLDGGKQFRALLSGPSGSWQQQGDKVLQLLNGFSKER